MFLCLGIITLLTLSGVYSVCLRTAFDHYVIMLPPLCSHPVSFPPGAIYYHHFWRNPKFFTTVQFLSRLDRFSSTIFEEIRKKFTLPSLSPEHPVFVSPLLKKIVIFFDSIQFLSRMSRFFPTAFEKIVTFFVDTLFQTFLRLSS